MKWLGIIAGVVLAGIVGTVALAPRLIDWNTYRPEIAALAAGAIGRPVVIEGNIRAELFPTPQLTAGGIRVPGEEGGADIASIRWAEARFKFSDLLRGDITMTGLALVEPDMTLSSSLLERVAAGPDADAASGATASAFGGTGGRDVSRIEIRNGTFRWAHAGATAFLAEAVSGQVETPAVGRRIAVSLTGRVRGRDLAMEMRFAPPKQGEAGPVDFVLTDTAHASTLRAGGAWTIEDKGLGMTGGFSLSGRDMSSLTSVVGISLPPAIAGIGGAVRMDGDFAVDAASSSLRLTELSANTDALSVTGSVAAQWLTRPRIDLSLRVGRLDLDAFDPSRIQKGGATGEGAVGDTGGDSAGMSPSVGNGHDLMTWIGTLPADLKLDLSVAGARLRDTVVRRIALRGSIDRGTVTLEELSAQLPGGTDLSVAGFGDMTGTEPLLEGNATLRADDLRRLLNWAGLPVPNVSADRLRRFSMVSGISLRPRRLDIIDAAVELDGVTANAAAAVALRPRPGIGLRLTLDHINLDAYRTADLTPLAGTVENTGNGSASAERHEGGAAAGTLEEGGRTAGLWSRFDASLELHVGRTVALGIPFNDVAGDLVLKDGILTVNELTFQDAGGISGTFGGQMAVTGEEDTVLLAFEGKSEDLGRVSALLEGPDFLSGFLRSMGPTAIKASYRPASDGPPLILHAEGTDGTLSFGANPLENEDGDRALDILSGAVDAHGVEISGLSGRMTFPLGVYQVEKLSGTLNGGTLHLSGSLRQREDGLRQLLITGALDGMDVGREIADLDGPIGLAGRISIRGQAEATGSDWRAMAALNNGWFDIDGAVALRVGPARPSVVTVKQVNETRAALREHFTQPATVQGELLLENGALTTKGMTLKGKDGGVLALTGRLRMNDLTLSAEAVLRKGADAPQFARLIAEGPAAAPNLRLEGAGASGD